MGSMQVNGAATASGASWQARTAPQEKEKENGVFWIIKWG